jgi:hypothetical protein
VFGRLFSGVSIDQGLKTTNPIVVLNSEVAEERRRELVLLASAIPLCELVDLCGGTNRSVCRDSSEGCCPAARLQLSKSCCRKSCSCLFHPEQDCCR